VTATTDPRLYIACSHCRLEKESTWETSLTPTHTIAARKEQRWWGQVASITDAQRLRRITQQRDVGDLLRNAMFALHYAT